ncbi:MAG TPA: hypothetical protein VF911_17425 [Thermoanaerobaculia bacterium]
MNVRARFIKVPVLAFALVSVLPLSAGTQPKRTAVGTIGLTPPAAANEIVRVSDGNGGEVEVLRGESARAHLRNLKMKSPKAFKASEENLRRRGFEPTSEVLVVRSTDPSVAPAQTTVESSAGEIVFWSWTDGDDATWEGSMYATKYSTGEEVIHDSQLDTSSNHVMWEYLAYETPRQRYQTTANRLRHPSPYVLLARQPATAASYATVGTVRPRVRDWVGCVVGTCAGAAYGCVLSGPAWPQCVVLTCAGAKVGCTLQWIISNWP